MEATDRTDVPEAFKLLPAAAEGFPGVLEGLFVDVFLALGLWAGESGVYLAARAGQTYGSCCVPIGI